MEKWMSKTEWLLCPVCGNKTRDKIWADTELRNFPLFCPKCKQETLVNVKQLHISFIKEPDAKTIICENQSSRLSALFVFIYKSLLLIKALVTQKEAAFS